MKQSASKEAAHTAGIRDLDFAHQADHLLASCGEDCRVKVWDLRLSSNPPTSRLKRRLACCKSSLDDWRATLAAYQKSPNCKLELLAIIMQAKSQCIQFEHGGAAKNGQRMS